MPFGGINHILNGEGVINKLHFNIRVVARRLNNDLTDIKSHINWIAHVHLDVLDFVILYREILLIKEKKLALNIDDALGGENVDVIDIVEDGISNHKKHYKNAYR